MTKKTRKPKGRARAKGEGSVFQRKDGRWVAHLTIENSKKPYQRYFKTQKEATAHLTKVRHEQQTGILSVGGQITVTDFLDRWLEFKKRTTKPLTYLSYENAVLIHLQPALGKKRLDKLKPLDLEDFAQTKSNEVSKNTARYSLKILTMALRQAVRWELVGRNVGEAVTPPKVERKEMKVWTGVECNRFLEFAVLHRNYALYHLEIMSGIRSGEIRGLKWGDVDFARHTITIKRTVIDLSKKQGGVVLQESTKTAKSTRTISISEDTIEALRAHKERQNVEKEKAKDYWQDMGLVFPNEVGTPIDKANFRRASIAIMKEAKLPLIRFHDLRHTHASLLAVKGTSIDVVADRLGHEDSSITQGTYTHSYPTQKLAAAMGRDELLGVAKAAQN